MRKALLFITVCSFIVSNEALAGCSRYLGDVVINEVLTTRVDTIDPFVELYVINAITVADGWKIIVQGNEGTSPAATQAVPPRSYSAGSYIVLSFSGGEIKNPGNDVLLQDELGEDVDFLRFGGRSTPLATDCPSLDVSSVEYRPTDQQVCTIPDAGEWASAVCTPTPGGANRPDPGSCALGGFELLPAATALACPQTRAAVGVRALCADLSTTKTDYSGTLELSSDQLGTLFYPSATAAVPVTQFSFSGSEGGQATLYYAHNDEALVSVSVTDVGPSPAVTRLGSATDFRAFGFKVDALSALSACAVSPSYALTAFGQVEGDAGCGVIEGFSGVKSLKIWSEYLAPASNPAGTPVRVNGVAVATSESTLYSMLFTGGVAPFALSYADAGQLKLRFKHEQSPYDGTLYSAMLAETNAMAVIPYGFGISASTAAGSLHGSDYASAQKQAAGAPFYLRIQAQCADGTPTPNYQPANARMTLTQTLASKGSLTLQGGAYVPDGLAVDISALFAAGVLSDSAASYSEVGVVQMSVEDSAYLGAYIPATQVDIGRFHPADFELSVLDDGALESGCGSFVYTGQLASAGEGAVSYSTSPPRLRMVPRNAAGALTQNYRGDFMRLTAADISITAPGADASQLGSDALTPMRLTSSLAAGTLTEAVEAGRSGYLYYALSGSDHYSYDRDANSQIAPFNADLNLALAEVKDADAVSASGALPVLKPAAIEVLFGRLRVENAFGPETEALPVLAQTEYFNGVEFVRNVQDSCSPIALDILDPAVGRLASGGGISVGSATSVVQLNSSAVDLGDLALAFGAPGLGASGEISFQLSDRDNTASSGIGSLPWLLFDWDGDGRFDDDPGVRKASFGRYRGHDRVIFWQENFSR